MFGKIGSVPRGIAIDRDGNVYTANTDTNTVIKITPDGNPSVFGRTGSYPDGITVDSDGNVYTVNFKDNTVTKIEKHEN